MVASSSGTAATMSRAAGSPGQGRLTRSRGVRFARAKVAGGFVLQRTGRGEPARWLLIKRRDEHARAGSDVLAERPH